MNLVVAKKLIENLGVECDTASSGSEAIEKVTGRGYDLILMDHLMPDMDGVETTKTLREKGYTPEKLPIALFTSNAIEDIQEAFTDAKFNDYIPKPIERGALMNLLKKWLPEGKFQDKTNSDASSNKEACSKQIAKVAEEIKEINIEEALKRVDNKSDILESSLKIITRKLPEIVDKMNNSLFGGDIKNFTIEVHGVKGSLMNVGANDIAKLAEELETRSRDQDVDFCRQNLPELSTQLLTLCEKLSKIINSLDNNSTPKKQGDAKALRKQIKEVEKCINDFKIDEATVLLAKMMSCTYGEKTDSFLQKLSRLTEEFEYEKAIELITKEKI